MHKLVGVLLGSALAGMLALGYLASRSPSIVEAAAPSRDAFTIYLLGGSTAAGVPYASRSDLGRILERLYPEGIRGRPLKTVNLARGGEDAAFALEQAREIVRREPSSERCVVFLLTGNNEYLSEDTRNDLSREERALFDRAPVSPSERAAIYERFERTLAEILDELEGAGLPVVLSTVPINLADWEPNRSVLEDDAHRAFVQERLEAGEAALASGDAERAVAEFRAVVDLEPRFAWGQERLGEALEVLERWDEAREAHLAAAEHDANPIAAPPHTVNGILRRLARERDVPLVQADEILRAASPHGLPGYDLFWDNVHPGLEGYRLIALGFAEALASRLDFPRPASGMQVDELAEALGIDERVRADANHLSGRFCYGSAMLVWKPDARLARADVHLSEAARLAPDDPEILCSLGVLRLLRGEVEGSREAWLEARRLDPQLVAKRLRHPRLREILSRHGLTPDDFPSAAADAGAPPRR